MSYSLEPRNGRGLSVEGNMVYPCEAETEHPVQVIERGVGIGRPCFVGSHPYIRGEFVVADIYLCWSYVSPLYTRRV